MEKDQLDKLIKQMESELTGDPDRDAEIMNAWGERYRGDPDAEPFLYEISRRLFSLVLEEEGDLTQEIFDDMVATADDDFEEACNLIEEKQYEDALSKLLVLTAVIRAYSLPEDAVWMDFNSMLDSMVFQDYFSEEIGDREIRRHPMHPGRILFTCGSLLIEMDRAEEALEPLEMLLDLDPVCPKYIFEIGEAYKRIGNIQEAYDQAIWALSCVSSRKDLARCYRDLGYCLVESGAYEDAVMLYMLSLRYQTSRKAEAELAWIHRKSGASAEEITYEMILKRCEELEIPVGISETVKKNMELMDLLMPPEDDSSLS